jgi:hypothetical protein
MKQPSMVINQKKIEAPKSDRPFSDAGILRRCRSYGAQSKPSWLTKPKRKLFVTNERKPTVKECMAIAKSRNLPGPGVVVAGVLGTLRVADFMGQKVYGIGDADGPLAGIRRIDGKPFYARNESDPVKSLSLVSGARYHRPYGYCYAPGIKGVALGEGVPDYLALCEAAVIESTIVPGHLKQSGLADHARENLPWVPLMMLSATSKLEPGCSYVGDFRGLDVLLVPHTDGIGISKAKGWFNAVKGFAKSTSVFDCAKVRGQLGDDFNDVVNLISERILLV